MPGPCPKAPAEPFPRFPVAPKREVIIVPLSACNRWQGCELLQVPDPEDANARRRRRRSRRPDAG